MLKKCVALVLCLTFACSAVAQTAKEPVEQTEAEAKLQKQAVEFLRETAADVGNMRSPENRISFGAELAGLMWYKDDREARAMYTRVVADFRDLLAQYDAELNSAAIPDDDQSSPGLFSGATGSPAERKLNIAMAVRQQIALSLAEHEPDLAFDFYFDTIALISNPEKRKRWADNDRRFEVQLIQQIADSNTEKGLKFALASVKSGLSPGHIEVLKKLYAKDEAKGIEFGAALFSKVKSERTEVKNLYVFSELLSFAADNFDEAKKKPNKKPVYTEAELREMADLVGQMVLAQDDDYSSWRNEDEFKRFAPSRALQIAAKRRKAGAANVMAPPPRAIYGNSAVAVGTATSFGSANSNSAPNSQQLAAEARDRAEKKAMEDVMSLGKKDLPKEERDKIIAQARKIIAETPGKDKKIVGLSMLAAQVAHAGDKELAAAIMKDADRRVNPAPKNYRDFMLTWMLASGYAEADPEKAFPLLNDTIGRMNEYLSAFVKVAEFIDVNEELISDGEIQVGAFGGSMIRGLTSEVGIANTTLRSLSRADFAKTRDLTNGFDRIETRVLAKMLVLRAVLGQDEKKPEDPSGMLPDGVETEQPR